MNKVEAMAISADKAPMSSNQQARSDGDLQNLVKRAHNPTENKLEHELKFGQVESSSKKPKGRQIEDGSKCP